MGTRIPPASHHLPLTAWNLATSFRCSCTCHQKFKNAYCRACIQFHDYPEESIDSAA